MSHNFSEASSVETSEKITSKCSASEAFDYRQTVFLPQTSFPMKGNLPKHEPGWLKHWKEIRLSQKIADKNRGKPVFLLHDGPPYANGHLHIGHAMNKILKDVICRAKRMSGFDVSYIPGWDCHGLPIEWKVEEAYRKQGKDKDQVPILDFRAECRAYAAEWVKIQSEEFQRLGINGEWNNPYITMDFAAEAAIVREIGKFLLSGELYQGLRPVMWSPVEKTALAEAEVEYYDYESQTIFVAFPLIRVKDLRLSGVKAVAWTTTPWTIPGNRALAYGEKIFYALIEVKTLSKKNVSGKKSLVKPGDKYLIAQELVEEFCKKTGIVKHNLLHVYQGSSLAGTVAAHPLKEAGYTFEVPLLPGEHVTIEQGTGFVHIAPAHGEEDFALGLTFNLEIPETIDNDGTYFNHVPLFSGLHIYKASTPIAEALQRTGNLVGSYKLVHSYPHSWRSKAPIIFRTTPQWFIRMDGPLQIRKKALEALQKTTFIPKQGINRISSMVSSRPDWCISRQRAWGVPLPVFTKKKTGEILRDPDVIARIEAVFAKEGADAWYKRDKADFLGEKYRPDDYDQVQDIIDVWFESGSTHAFVLEKRHLPSPADLYLEGSDQHRGWFQSSLLESIGTRGRAPFKTILTHGFVMDEAGRKMSKSLGNVVAPEDVIQQYGADILRLWIMNSDSAEDLRIGHEILRQQSELYRRLRNTLRWILGNLQDFSSEEALPYEDLPDLEKFILHRLTELRQMIKEAVQTHQWTGVYPAVHNFCTADLSAFYFDVRKDTLYCDKKDSPTRKAALTVLDILHQSLCCFLAPVLVFTAEEAFTVRFGSEKSVHLEDMPDFPTFWNNPVLAQKINRLREIRKTVTTLLEKARIAGKIGSSFEAEICLSASDEDLALISEEDWENLALVSSFRFKKIADNNEESHTSEDGQITVFFAKASGKKCVRCRKVLPSVGQQKEHPLLCKRCTDAVVSSSFPITRILQS